MGGGPVGLRQARYWRASRHDCWSSRRGVGKEKKFNSDDDLDGAMEGFLMAKAVLNARAKARQH
jgi:hypothetical protein